MSPCTPELRPRLRPHIISKTIYRENVLLQIKTTYFYGLKIVTENIARNLTKNHNPLLLFPFSSIYIIRHRKSDMHKNYDFNFLFSFFFRLALLLCGFVSFTINTPSIVASPTKFPLLSKTSIWAFSPKCKLSTYH